MMWEKRIDLACSLLNYSAHPFQRGLEGIARAGYRFVMLGGEHPIRAGAPEKHRPLHGRMTDRELQTLKKQVADAGLEVKSGIIGLEIHLEEPGGAELYRREIDLWAGLGVKRVVGLGPWYYKKWPNEIHAPEVWRATCERYYQLLDEFRPAMEKAGLTICIKPHTGICAHSGLVLPTMQRLNAACYQVCWDAGNVSFYEGVCPDPGLDKIVPYIKAVCLKDHLGPRANPVFPPLGEGNVDHDAYFGLLAAGGFAGVMMIERLGVREGETLTAEQIDQRGGEIRAYLKPLLEKYFRREKRQREKNVSTATMTGNRRKGLRAAQAGPRHSPTPGEKQNRIDATFQALQAQGRGAFMPYLSAGDPSLAVTEGLLADCAGAGADLVEIGFPFSDPIADGPVIQASFHRALTQGLRVDDIFAMIARVRRRGLAIPLLAMASVTLYNARGGGKFARDAKAAGLDGLILPDLPGDRATAARAEITAAGLHLINFIAPNTPAARRKILYRTAQGFLYYMSITGLTGARTALSADLARQLRDVKRHTPVPVAVGFGISTPAQVQLVQSEADGAIVGSALVHEIQRLAGKFPGRGGEPKVIAGGLKFIRALAGR